jgi:hypothetical protein
MRILLLACLSAGLPVFGQTAPRVATALPEDARAILAAVLPSYDLHHPSLKPFHLKVAYQLHDRDGAATRQGIFEYWWASPQIHRSTWTSAGAVHTDWHTTNGQAAHQTIGERPQFLEYQLENAFVAPLSALADLDAAKTRLDRESISVTGGPALPCVTALPSHYDREQRKKAPLGLFPTYCFDSTLPVLRVSYSPGTVATEFNKIVRMQNRYIAREILMFDGRHLVLSAQMESIAGLDPGDPALIPAAAASTAASALASSELH